MGNNSKKMLPSPTSTSTSTSMNGKDDFKVENRSQNGFDNSVDSFPAASFSTSGSTSGVVSSQKKNIQAPLPGVFSYAAAAAANKINSKTTEIASKTSINSGKKRNLKVYR